MDNLPIYSLIFSISSLENSENIINGVSNKRLKAQKKMSRPQDWIERRKALYHSCKNEEEIKKEDASWLYYSSEEEKDKKISSQIKLLSKDNAKLLKDKWDREKKYYKILRPKKIPKEWPELDLKDNTKIFKKLPEYFKVNPFFQDLDTRLGCNWFNIREDKETLKNLGKIESRIKPGSGARHDTLKKSVALAAFVPEVKSLPKNIEKSSTSRETSFNASGYTDNIPGTIELTNQNRIDILKKANMFRQEFGLKAIKSYFNTWKRTVVRHNEKELKKIKEIEKEKSKTVSKQSLIKKETNVTVKKDKSYKKELYYQKTLNEIVLTHKLPGKLTKFIKNCNNIYASDKLDGDDD
jgi:hypothetical protein